MINIYKLLTEYNTKLKIKTSNKTLKFLKISIYMYIVYNYRNLIISNHLSLEFLIKHVRSVYYLNKYN